LLRESQNPRIGKQIGIFEDIWRVIRDKGPGSYINKNLPKENSPSVKGMKEASATTWLLRLLILWEYWRGVANISIVLFASDEMRGEAAPF